MATALISRFMFVGAVGSMLAAAQISQATSSVPPGAFLTHPARDVSALNREIQKDPIVAARYARLYNMSPDMVRMAFSNLHLSTLTEDHIYQVHYVHPGERIGYKLRRVRRGTAVYRLPDGTPALVRVCGNPLKDARPKKVLGAYRRSAELGQPDSVLDFQPDEPLESYVNPSPEPSFGPRVGEPYTGFVDSPDVVSEIPETPVGLGPVAATAAAVHTVSSFANAVPILGALGALGGLGALAAGGGGSHSTPGAPFFPPVIPPVIIGPGAGGPGPVTPPAAVTNTPEPSAAFFALAMLSSGGVGLLRRRRKARRP